jgi:hypothetical protein
LITVVNWRDTYCSPNWRANRRNASTGRDGQIELTGDSEKDPLFENLLQLVAAGFDIALGLQGFGFLERGQVLPLEVLDERDLDDDALAAAVDELAEQRLAGVAGKSAGFSAAMRAYRRARLAGDDALAEGLLAWIGGQPNVAASVKRVAGVKGDLDHYGALSFLQGLLTVLRDSGHPGLSTRDHGAGPGGEATSPAPMRALASQE